MLGDECAYPFSCVGVRLHAGEYLLGEVGASQLVELEVPHPLLVQPEHLRLSDVVEQHHRPEQRIRLDVLHTVGDVLPHVVAVVLVVLLKPEAWLRLGDHLRDDLLLLPQHLAGVGLHQQRLQLRPYPLRRHVGQQTFELHGGFPRGLVDGKACLCCEPYRPKYPQRVLVEALAGGAHAADNAPPDVPLTVKGVIELSPQIDADGVHSEVPALQVAADIPDEGDGIRSAVIGIVAVAAVGGDLYLLPHDDDGEGSVFQPRWDSLEACEYPQHLLRHRRGTHVPVVGCCPPEGVPDAAADAPGFKPCPLQQLESPCRGRRYLYHIHYLSIFLFIVNDTQYP